MTIHSRKPIREKLKDLLVATGDFTAVYEYEPKTLADATKVAAIRSASSKRARIFDGTQDNFFGFEIVIFVLRAGEGSLAADVVEDTLDDLEQSIAEVVDANTVLVGYWESLFYGEAGSQCVYTTIEGKQYRAEIIPLEVQYTI